MAKTDLKYEKQNLLASFFGKKYGEFLYSGTLAVETALISTEIKPGDYVLIPNNVCYRILLSLARLKVIPIIVTPQNGYVLTEFEIMKALEQFPVKAIILVHNLGLPVDIAAIKEICDNRVEIIEDAAQAWDIKCKGNSIGKSSDYVITSFGISKPLSLGVGGAIFSNDEKFRHLIDNYDNNSRVSDRLLLPYTLPVAVKFDVSKLINIADNNVFHQRSIANVLIKELKNMGLNFWELYDDDNPTWHRFPVWTDSQELFNNLITQADRYHVKYELPHKITLDNTPMAISLNSIHMDYSEKKYYHILIKTRQNLLVNIRKWTKIIKSKNLKK